MVIGTEIEFLIYELPDPRFWVPHPLDHWRIASLETIALVFDEIAAQAGIRAGEAGDRLWLANGACVYVDGELLEYATPECTTARSAVAYELVGRKIIARACKAVQDAMGKHLAALAISSGPGGIEAGHHENYGLTHDQYFNLFGENFWPKEVLLETLVPHLISRVIWSASGAIEADGSWAFSPRASRIDRVWDWDTENHRPIIHLKRPNLSETLLRVEITCGDIGMLPKVLQLKLGSTAAVLLAASQGILSRIGLSLQDPVQCMRGIGKSPLVPLHLRDGRIVGALDVQRTIQQEVLGHADEIDRRPDFDWDETMELWDEMLTDLERAMQ